MNKSKVRSKTKQTAVVFGKAVFVGIVSVIVLGGGCSVDRLVNAVGSKDSEPPPQQGSLKLTGLWATYYQPAGGGVSRAGCVTAGTYSGASGKVYAHIWDVVDEPNRWNEQDSRSYSQSGSPDGRFKNVRIVVGDTGMVKLYLTDDGNGISDVMEAKCPA